MLLLKYLGKVLTETDPNGTIIAYDALSRKTNMNDPDMGYWHYGYDKNGNLTSQIDAKNQTIRFTYDQLDRIKDGKGDGSIK